MAHDRGSLVIAGGIAAAAAGYLAFSCRSAPARSETVSASDPVDGAAPPNPLVEPSEKMTLEKQLEELAKLALPLNEGVSVDDFLASFDRGQYEKAPFDLVMFAIGTEIEREPWGRRFSDRAWYLDMECIEDGSAYEKIVKNISMVAGAPGVLSDPKAEVDLSAPTGTLSYRVSGKVVNHTVTVNDDWADPKAIAAIMRDIEKAVPAGAFYGKDNGQGSTWFFLTPDQASRLKALGADISRGP